MKYIGSKPQVASEHPVIRGIQIRVAHVLSLRLEGASFEEIHGWYPWISLNTLRGASMK
ncbi:DUF433 domain-containing protein [Streptomyces sp. NPDC053079]|uniref:DUF433 domain-containing protein n=1 Tax=Streptomyces sp. NPDC053079 TaxID=3365697 RepID=UPI0037D53C02